MTDEIQKLKDILFSHYFFKDYDEKNNHNSYKGIITPDNVYALNGLNILGQRHPLYLRALIDSLACPTELSCEKAIEKLTPTINYLKEIFPNLNHYPHISIHYLQEFTPSIWSHLVLLKNDHNPESITCPLIFNMAITFSNKPIKAHAESSFYLPSLFVLYQNSMVKLFKEQNFFQKNGRFETLTQYISQKASTLNLKSEGLNLYLDPSFSENKLSHYFLYNKKTNHIQLHFPLAITNQQIDDIFYKLSKIKGD